MRIGRKDERDRGSTFFVAAEEATHIAAQAPELLGRAAGVDWYDRPGSDVDYAAYMLCRLRRARAGALGAPAHGDEAVRAALLEVDRDALAWFTSRAVSYMDENGFPEDVERWFAPRPE